MMDANKYPSKGKISGGITQFGMIELVQESTVQK